MCRQQVGTITWAVDRHLAFGAAIDRADFFVLGRTIPFRAPLVADDADRFFRQKCSLREIPSSRALKFPKLAAALSWAGLFPDFDKFQPVSPRIFRIKASLARQIIVIRHGHAAVG